MCLEFVKRLIIIISMMYILTKSHVKNSTPNTPHIPSRFSQSISMSFNLTVQRSLSSKLPFRIYFLRLHQVTYCYLFLFNVVHRPSYVVRKLLSILASSLEPRNQFQPNLAYNMGKGE